MTNGADILAQTLVAQGVDTCFANPGTTEMHLLAALGRTEGLNLHLCLFEGVVTGAADGYARMSGKPAATLLHLGPGLANAMANLHNARKAATPMINIVGEHATYHLACDAPLTSDIAAMAGTVSDHVTTPQAANNVAQDTAAALAAIAGREARVATIIVPNDVAWTETEVPSAALPVAQPQAHDPADVDPAADALRQGPGGLLLIGAPHITRRMAELAQAISDSTGCRVFTEAAVGRMSRGGSAPSLRRLPFHVDPATSALEGVADAVLVGARAPVAFFAYPGRPSDLLPPDASVLPLCPPLGDVETALEALAEALGATCTTARKLAPLAVDAGAPITAETLGAAVAWALPNDAIVVDESITNGLHLFANCGDSPAQHDWINNRGGSIGYSLPVSVGAAVACRDRPVLCITGDGSAAYTPQALWTMARSRLNVTVVILANRSYRILTNEMSKIGAGAPNEFTLPLMSLEDPAPDWVKIAEGHGVPGERVSNARSLAEAVARCMAEPGPRLIEAVM
ncbi:acetolactate synthase large subunit [Alloyangia pacifica]|uniref:acetolactate synthase large subunit n=1 Tax=Alloyangia pacifica TaxID=311180 RepID=UPI0031E1BF59